MFPTVPENDAIVQKLFDMLCALPIGSTQTYAQMSETVDRDLQGAYRYLLNRARERAEKELGCIFECSRSLGITRLPSEMAADVGLSAVHRVRRAANRGGRRLGRIRTNSMSDTDAKKVVSYRCILGAISLMADGNKARTVAAVVDPANPIPPVGILDMFAGKKTGTDN